MLRAVSRPALTATAVIALVLLAGVAMLAMGAWSPAGAEPVREAESELISSVRGYSEETEQGYLHVSRWYRVLKSLGALEPMTSMEAQGYAAQYLASRWAPVATALALMEQGGVADPQVIADVETYAKETENGTAHVKRWMRALDGLGGLEAMTAAEAQTFADKGWTRWVPVARRGGARGGGV